jgi:hypothetical protein
LKHAEDLAVDLRQRPLSLPGHDFPMKLIYRS